MSQTDSLNSSPVLEQLLQLKGVASSYINYAGETVTVPLPHRLQMLAAMGVSVPSADDLPAFLDHCVAAEFDLLLRNAEVIPAQTATACPVFLPDATQSRDYRWQLETEAGTFLQGKFNSADLPSAASDIDVARARFPHLSRLSVPFPVPIPALDELMTRVRYLSLPALPAGYHLLSIHSAEASCSCTLIAAPPRCFEPDWVQQGKRLGGLSVQVYSLRSERNWGIGDFTDLRELVSLAATAGVQFLVLNPLHFLDISHPEQCSPYSPMDRRFLNPLYIDPCIEPDFCENPEIKNYTGKPAFQKRLAQLRDESLVDYRSVTRLKLVVLGKMYRHFCRTQLESGGERGRAYRSWLAAKGDSLAVFAEFEAARHRFAMDQTRHREFHCYLQWLAENQLESCQQLALQQGMVTGLVRDLAVGGSSRSAEVELNPGLFCLRASIGAPPDPLAPLGQKWGLPPLDPLQLRLSGYHHFIELLGSNMEHCGALRIDHVMSLMRLWWCPADGDSSTGAYVHYPVDELFAILRLESTRRRCVVIGEDLGVVPPEIRRYMTESAVFSNVLFYFEKYDSLHFRHPAHFPRRALAMIANHDVPPLAAWWNKSDLALRQRIGLMESETVMADAVRSRESDLIQILHWLNEQSLLPESWRDFNIHRQFDFSLCHAILQANGRCASQLVSLQLEDLSLEQMPVNIPGTSNEYPNWQRKLPTCTDQLFSAPESRTMLDIFVGARNQS